MNNDEVKMIILHITAMAPLSPNSGIPSVLRDLAEYQNRIHSVESYVLSLKADVKDINSTYFFYLGKDKVYSFLEREKPDLAIIHSFFHVEYVGVTRALIKLGIPFLIEPHGSFGKKAMKKSHLKKTIANNTIFRSQIKDSQGYIFTNQAEYKDSIYKTKNELVIPNGIIPDIVNDAKDKSEESIMNPTIYYLGRFDIHHKGLDFLFDALEVLEKQKHKIRIRLYGTGDKKQLKYVNTRIANYKVLDVKNCGTIYGDAKKNALENSNILILTSRYEGSPMTVLDALSYGNPCIVTPGTNTANEIVENRIGWCAELSVDAIAKTILKALSEYCVAGADYYKRCKKYVLDNYSWERIAEYSIEQYKEILQKTNG